MHRCARQEDGGQTFRSTLEDQTTESLASEITSKRDYPDERSIYEGRECDWSARSVAELSVGPVTGRGISAWLRE